MFGLFIYWRVILLKSEVLWGLSQWTSKVLVTIPKTARLSPHSGGSDWESIIVPTDHSGQPWVSKEVSSAALRAKVPLADSRETLHKHMTLDEGGNKMLWVPSENRLPVCRFAATCPVVEEYRLFQVSASPCGWGIVSELGRWFDSRDE